LLADARRDADSIAKQSELDAKEQLLKRKEQQDRELQSTRDQLRNAERALDKREASLNEIQEDIRKKEKMLQTTQQRLAEKAKAVETREKELERIIREEQEELHKISGLTHEVAAERLLKRVEQD